MIKVVNNFLKRVYLPYSFYLMVLLNFTGGCRGKKPASPLPLSKQVEAANRASCSSSPVPESNVVPMNNSGSGEEDQSSIIRLDTMAEEEKQYREKFSQALSAIKDLSERDKMIGSFVKERELRMDRFNLLLKEVIDPNEEQRLIREFDDTKGMREELRSLNGQYVGVSEEKAKKRGDIVEKYTGWKIESRRNQIRRRVEALMQCQAVFSNRQEQGAQCVICHSTGSVDLLPCNDYVHVGCLVEEMISVWRQGIEYAPRCPGSCGNYLSSSYFLCNDDKYANAYLNPLGLKEIFVPIQS